MTVVTSLQWIKCGGATWCEFEGVNLAHNNLDNIEGVYIIWYGTPPAAAVIRIGQGIIRDRIGDHRNDPEIKKYSRLGMFVTWAVVPAGQRNGVENYLSDQLKPVVGERFPNATPIPVNLPW
jgi:hypothetical protein